MKKLAAGAAALSAVSLGVAIPSAEAAPSNAPSAITGTFDCFSSGLTGTFVVNSGNAQAAQTWNVAHLTFPDGSTGIFVPTVLDLTVSVPGQPPFNSFAVKGNGNPPASQLCEINAPLGGGATLSGLVAGNIV